APGWPLRVPSFPRTSRDECARRRSARPTRAPCPVLLVLPRAFARRAARRWFRDRLGSWRSLDRIAYQIRSRGPWDAGAFMHRVRPPGHARLVAETTTRTNTPKPRQTPIRAPQPPSVRNEKAREEPAADVRKGAP